MTCDVAIRGTGPAALYCALTLAPHLKVALFPSRDLTLDTHVLWPGLTEHWGLLKENLGDPQTEALIQVMQRSRELLEKETETRRGAVLQLASNDTEFQEMTMHLRWLNEIWPRRLMSAGSASNYVPVQEIAGAAFIPACLAIDETALTTRLFVRLQTLQATVLQQAPATQEILVDADPQLPGLFTQTGAEFLCAHISEPWNAALVGIETQRGHLHIRPHPKGMGWLVSGVAPEGIALEHPEILRNLAAQALAPLEGLMTEDVRPLSYRSSADGLPVVGPAPGNPRKWWLGALAGRSWSLGPALGEQVGLALLGQPSPLLNALPCLRPSRFLR
ncbi:MAG: FAD-binding oxidoreductase [Candidatus Eremiobacteraeota bacterium]|nr:FAD-binding oxidoreductase [Candidatus Eremiobacteraeota bacterium]MCW5872305.1 FAD-binding oxidoreductase [Candidatus Eremiobacteraeota bacterium]